MAYLIKNQKGLFVVFDNGKPLVIQTGTEKSVVVEFESRQVAEAFVRAWELISALDHLEESD